MTTKNSKIGYSRMKARRKVKKIHPNLPTYKVVHHVDLNPFNNDMDNFAIINNSDHIKLHWLLHPEKMGITKSLLDDLKTLESWLIFYNNNYAI